MQKFYLNTGSCDIEDTPNPILKLTAGYSGSV